METPRLGKAHGKGFQASGGSAQYCKLGINSDTNLISKEESPRCGQGSEDFRLEYKVTPKQVVSGQNLVLVVRHPRCHLGGDLVGQAGVKLGRKENYSSPQQYTNLSERAIELASTD